MKTFSEAIACMKANGWVFEVTARDHAYAILYTFFRQRKRLKEITDSYFRRHRLEPSVRAHLTAYTREVIRWTGRLDWWLRLALDRPGKRRPLALQVVLRQAVYELFMDPTIPDYAVLDEAVKQARKKVGPYATGLVNAILRKLTQYNPEIPPGSLDTLENRAAWYSFPSWLMHRWEQRYGQEQTVELANYFNHQPPHHVRRNPDRLDEETFFQALEAAQIDGERFSDSDRFYRIIKGGQQLLKHRLFREGAVSFQDRGAGAIVEFLAPQEGELILDVCAAPGTKSVYLAEYAHDRVRVLASDVNPRRVAAAQKDLQRHNLTSLEWSCKDATRDSFPHADAVLIDAPCTGTGIFGRRPDARWRRQPGEIETMADLQLKLLTHMQTFVKPGGRLVYSTCSLEPEENWQVVETFNNLSDRFMIDSAMNYVPLDWTDDSGALSTWPPRHGVDGMFAVRLVTRS
ncbi:MAG: 16S rRNA (cytosine(967)-C(5))-methyltransferase RsmB [Fidelibacterota bacterium]